MANAVIIIILLILLAFGFKETIRHFRGEGSCCGGPAAKVKKKKLKNKIILTYTIHVEGMKCSNCAASVTRAINDIDGAAATVSLKKKTARVSCDREISRDEIIAAVTRKGYDAF